MEKNYSFKKNSGLNFKHLLVVILLLIAGNTAFGQKIWSGSVSNSWDIPGNWVGGVLPTTTDNVEIPSAANYLNSPLINGGYTIKSLTIKSGGELTLAAGFFVLSEQNNKFLVEFGGLLTQTGGTIESYNVDVPLNNGEAQIAGTYTQTGGWYLSDYDLTISDTGIFTHSGDAILAIYTGGIILSGEINKSGTKRFDIENLFIESGGVFNQTSSSITEIVNITIRSGGTYNQSGTSYLRLDGDFIIESGGTFNSSEGLVTMFGPGSPSPRSILGQSGVCTFFDVELYSNRKISAASSFNVKGDFSHEGDIELTNNLSVTFNGTGTQIFNSAGSLTSGSVSGAGNLNYTVNSGATLQMADATTVVVGNSFILSAGATLGIKSLDGISAAPTATGNIQTTTRTFDSAANYIYNADNSASPYYTSAGTGLPLTVNNLSIETGTLLDLNTNGDTAPVFYTAETLILGGVPQPSGSYSGSFTFYLDYGYQPNWFTPTLALLTVNSCLTPFVTVQPDNQNITYGADAIFTVTDIFGVSYQWQEYTTTGAVWSNITDAVGFYSGATTQSLTVVKPTVAMSTNTYRCVVTNPCSNVSSDGLATLTVGAKALTVATTVADKNYDGFATTGVVSTGVISGEVNPGDVTINSAVSSDFADANVGNAKETTVTYTLVDALGSANNYSIAPLLTTGNIVLDEDGDGISNATEITNGTSPTDPCDPVQTSGYTGYDTTNLIWAAADCDGDGITNGAEDTAGFDPYKIDPSGYFYCEETGEILTGFSITVTGPNGSNTGIGSANGINIFEDGSTGSYRFTVDSPGGTYTLSYTVPYPASTTHLPGGIYDAQPAPPATVELGSADNGSNYLVDFTPGANPYYLGFKLEDGDQDVLLNNIPVKACGIDDDYDGVLDTVEITDGTDPLDNCSFIFASQTETPDSVWNNADCDGDGVINSLDSAPLNPCTPVQTAGYTGYNATNSIWAAEDCDSDGITNGAEVGGGTDPYNVDTDEDGNPDNLDLNPTNPTATNDVMNAVQSTLATYNILSNDDYLDNLDPNNLGTVVLTNLGTGSAVGTVVFDTDTGEMSYTPVSGEEGTSVTVDYQVCNGAVCATATVIINVSNDIDGDGISNSTDLDDDNDGNPDVTDPHPLDAIAQNDFMNALEEVATVYNILSNDDFLAGANTIITDTGAGTATGTISFNGATGVMTYTPASGEEGTLVTVIYQVCNDVNGDSPGTTTDDVCATATVVITVTQVNDIPSFTKGADVSVSEDAGPQTLVAWATAISAGKNNANVDNEVGQGLTFIVTNNTNNLFSVQPTVSPSGELAYTPALNAVGTATVSVTLTDDGGTANGGVNTSATQTFDIIINAVNDAPVLVSQFPQLTTITEDDAPSTEITVSTLLGGTTDVDINAQAGIAIYNSVGNGDWQFNIGSGWNPIPSVTVSNALLLRSIDQIRYSPDQENGEIATFSYFAWDDTVGAEGSQIDATTRGGTSAFSLEGDTAKLTVVDVNDAPVFNGPSPTYFTDENTPIVFTLTSLIGDTIGEIDNNDEKGIAIYSLPAPADLGTWQYNIDSGVWIDFPTIPGNEALLLPSTANIKYIPNNLSGEIVTFNYYAWDQTTGSSGTTANITSRGGTTAFSVASGTATITVATLQDDSVIALNKEVSAGPYNVGSTATFTVVVTNNGPEDATGIDVVDQLPSGYTFVSPATATQGSYNDATGLWAIGSLANSTTATLTVDAIINATGNYTNIAEVTSVDQIDPNGIVHGNNTPGEIDQAEVTIVPVPIIDLVTTKTVNNPTPNVGEEITYTLSVVNNGPNDATGVVVTDNLPAGVTYTGHLATGGNVNTYSSGLWNVGTILSGSSADITINATIDAGQGGNTITNEITVVSSTETDLSPTIDDATATVIVTSSNLVTAKTVDNSTPDEGDTITYSIAVTNNGPSDATGVSLTDLLPAGVTYVSDDSSGTYNSGSGIWVIGDIGDTATTTLTITATVDVGTGGSTIINNTTTATGEQTDPTAVGDILEAGITVNNDADIVLTKVVDNDTPNTGDTVTYTITVTNAGPAEANNLVVEDVLPTGLSFGTITPSIGVWNETSPLSGDWEIGNLAEGDSETLVIEALVAADGTIPQVGLVNAASNTQDQIDSSLPSVATATVTVRASDLVTIKTVSDATPDEGDTITYSIAVTNNGPSDSTGVSLTDLLPDGVTYVSDNIGDDFNEGSGIWTIGDLANTDTVTLTITATVNVATSGNTITNYTTAATGEQTDPTAVGDILEAGITVNNDADIVLTKVVDNATPNTGDIVTYTITVTNAGPALVTNLVIEDVLPTDIVVEGDPIPTTGLWSAPYWTVGTLESGTTETLVIEALVLAEGTLSQIGLVNTVSNTQDQIDSNLTLDVSTATVTVTAANLVTIKTVTNTNTSKTVYEEGDTVKYTITVENQGPSLATGVSLTDLLPIGVTYVSDNTPGLYNSGDGNWIIGELGIGASAILEIVATIDSGTANSTITNFTTAATAHQTDPITSDVLEATIYVENDSDIVLTKVVDNETPNTGDTVTYTITVTNAGPAEATNLVVEDVLPTGLSFGTITPSIGVWSETSPLSGDWEIGNLAEGDSETLVIEALVAADGTIPQVGLVNAASNTQDQIDSSLPSIATATVTVTASDLVTVKTVSDATPEEGDTITYSIAVTNNGPSNATGVSLVDLLPDGVTYVSDNIGDDFNEGSGIWTIGDLANTDTVTLTITATVDAGTSGDTITNYTTAAIGDQTDPNSDDDLEAIITVQNLSDIILTKVVDNETPNTGDIVTYTITVTNAGPALVTGLEVEDILPTGLEEELATPSAGLWNAPTWTIGDLAIDKTETLVIKALVTADGEFSQPDIINTATNTQDQVDSSLPSEASATINVTSTDLVTIKTVSPPTNLDGTYNELEAITYYIEVTNYGPSNATGVSLVDLLPIGVSYLDDNQSATYNSGDGNWMIGDLASGASITLEVVATVDELTSGDFINNITTAASGDQTDPDTTTEGFPEDDLEEEIEVSNESDILIIKEVDNAAPDTGDYITYTVTVTNNGLAVVTNLTVTDILPAGLEEALSTPSKGVIWNLTNWDIGTLGVGETETMTIRALVSAEGTMAQTPITNTASHAQDQVDSSLPSNASVDIVVTAADLETVKVVDNAEPYEGEIIVYTITVNNNGPTDATGVSLTDLLPKGVTYQSDNIGNAYNSGSGIWTIGDILEGTSKTINISAIVDEGTAGTSITNYTTAAVGDQTDPITNDDLEATIDVENYSDILLTKVVDNATPNEGDIVKYTVTVTNNGPAVVTNLVVTDALPEGVEESLVTPSNGTWTSPSWNINELAVGVTETLTIEAIVTAEGTMEQLPITNVVSNTQDQDDSNLTEDDQEEDIIVTASNLVTVKTVSDETPAEGDTITYLIAVTNNGPSNATGVSLVDLLPIGVTYVSDNAAGAYNSGDGNWMIGEITANATVTLEIMASVNEETASLTITNATTAATGDQTDPTVVGDDLEATIVVEDDADIVLTKVVDNATPNAGDTITYTITVTNNGPANASNLVVTDALPAGLKFGSIVSPSIGTWTAPNWTIGNLASGNSETIVIEAIVGLDQGGNTLINTVANSQDQIDSNLTQDHASETIVVTNSDLETLKTVSNAIPNEGDTITYTIQVTNNGPSNATNVSLVDNLPVGVTYVSHTSGVGTYNFGSGLWNIGNVSNGSTVMLTIVATVDDGTLGQTITNSTSAVIADQSDSDITNNIGSVSIVPTAYIDLSLTKTVVDDVVAPEVGDTITFEIRVNNEGPTEATGVQVTDLIPTGYDFVNYSSSIGTYNPITGLWKIGFIEIGNTAVLLVDVIVMDNGEYINCAEITAANEIDVDSTPDNADTSEDDYDCASAPPIQSLDLKIEKTVIADNLTPLVDTEVSFEIRVINDGDIEATEVVVTDLLPSGYTYLNYSSSRGTYDDDSGLWKIGRIVDGETEILVIDAIVNATGDYLNCATITEMHQIDPDLSNNTSCIATNPIPVADLELTKEVALSDGTSGPVSTIGILQPYAESNVDFTITLTNNGPSDATGVQVVDLLPNGYNFVSVSESLGTYDDGSGIWNVGTIANGTAETLIITAYVNPVGDWVNTAEVIAVNELDIDSTPNNGDLFEDDMDQIATDPIVLLTVAEGFTPNGDGINDVFEIEFLEVLYPNFSMEIVDRYGNLVYEYKHNGNPYQTPDWWNGFSGGRMNFGNDALPAGTYFYTIYFNNDDRKPQNGWVYLRK